MSKGCYTGLSAGGTMCNRVLGDEAPSDVTHSHGARAQPVREVAYETDAGLASLDLLFAREE